MEVTRQCGCAVPRPPPSPSPSSTSSPSPPTSSWSSFMGEGPWPSSCPALALALGLLRGKRSEIRARVLTPSRMSSFSRFHLCSCLKPPHLPQISRSRTARGTLGQRCLPAGRTAAVWARAPVLPARRWLSSPVPRCLLGLGPSAAPSTGPPQGMSVPDVGLPRLGGMRRALCSGQPCCGHVLTERLLAA